MCMRVIFELEVEIDGNYNIQDIEDYYAFQFGLTKHLPSDNALAKEKVLYSEVTNIQVLQYDKISGKGTWENNPLVVAYSFELVD